MRMTEQEQRLALDGQLLTIGKYWELRLGTSAVYLFLAFIEYVNPVLKALPMD